MEELVLSINKANVLMMFVNPFQIHQIINQDLKFFNKEYPKLVEFVNNNFELNNFPMNLLCNFNCIYFDGKVLAICWVASKEDKAVCIIKTDFFFRRGYRFYDIQADKEIHRRNIEEKNAMLN